MQIRHAELSDLKQIRQLLFQTWQSTFEPLYGPELVNEICRTWGASDELERRICAMDGQFLVCEVNGEIAGLSFIKEPTEQGIGFLSQLYVAENFQGQNIGKELLFASETAFSTISFMRLNVDVKNEAAVGFYKHLGYHDTKISFVRELKNQQVEALIFEKALPR